MLVANHRGRILGFNLSSTCGHAGHLETVDLVTPFRVHFMPSSILPTCLGKISIPERTASPVQVPLKMAEKSSSRWVFRLRTKEERTSPTQVLGQEVSQDRGQGTEALSTGRVACWL
ncbi:hypothetical protein BCR33DRAFT_486615 [Rhizoclosmatium globosum]|uniref:Uncharacterized protein n=1 Tax=Rhizoclosmatium globosum TaxID=329046 RepID=A0A1Y2BNB4_9FUNG|nr:hypothetical protein BCR33DRAFT_486615 [Rhizoclosmatium globosum]|eukprot:ORY36202.1 hypothetical protein BCR33DRAFT_486615 [Rhizoclosmatium globosum]